MKKVSVILFLIFFLISTITYILSKPDWGGRKALFRLSNFNMNEFSCENIPYFFYKPFPFSFFDGDSTQFKFKLPEREFKKFYEKYKNILNWEKGMARDGVSPGEREYWYKVPYLLCRYEYSSSRDILIYYVPSLQEIKFVIFNH